MPRCSLRLRLRFRNRVTIYSVGQDGRREVARRSNLVVDVGRERAARLLGGLSTAALSNCQIGDGGTDGVALNTPLAPAATDTALVNVLQDVTITSKVMAGTVLTLSTNFFTASPNLNPFLTANEVASEAGLVFGDGVLFARTTFPSIPFNVPARTGLVVVWEVEIV